MPAPLCFCCSKKPLAQCCGPLLEKQRLADSPEQLMRSRFSAYVDGNYEYVLATYANQRQATLSEAELAKDADGTRWFALQIVNNPQLLPTQVEFIAFYAADKHVCTLHETSNFVQEDGEWRYLDGELHVDCGRIKLGRNERCPCASGKKFKQCCAPKLALR